MGSRWVVKMGWQRGQLREDRRWSRGGEAGRARPGALAQAPWLLRLSSPGRSEVGMRRQGDRDGDPTRVGSVLKAQVQGGSWQARPLTKAGVTLCGRHPPSPPSALGAPGCLRGQEPEKSPKPRRAQSWSLIANGHPWSVIPQLQLDHVPPDAVSSC